MFGWATATRKRAADPSSLHNFFPQGAFMFLQQGIYDTFKKRTEMNMAAHEYRLQAALIKH